MVTSIARPFVTVSSSGTVTFRLRLERSSSPSKVSEPLGPLRTMPALVVVTLKRPSGLAMPVSPARVAFTYRAALSGGARRTRRPAAPALPSIPRLSTINGAMVEITLA